MQLARNTRNAPRTLGNAFIIVAGSALVVIVGCTMVGDRLTGARLNRSVPTTCVRACNDLYRTLVDRERKLHAANVEFCRRRPQPDRGACLDAEGGRHSAEMARLEQARVDCLDGCHYHGAGTAG